MSTKYRVHCFGLRMSVDQSKLEQFLNSLEGEIVAIIPNVMVAPSSPPAWIFCSSWEKRFERKNKVRRIK